MSKTKLHMEVIDTLHAAFPIVATNMVFACTGLLCTMMIANLGESYLASSVIVSTLWMALSLSFCGVLSAIGVLISHAFGANDKKSIGDIMQQSYLLGVLLCATLIFMVLKTPFFLKYLISDPKIYAISCQYLFAQVWSLPGLIFLTIYEQFFIGIGQSKLILKVSLLVVPLEIFFSYVFAFGWFGLPAFALSGIGYGLAVTFNTTAILMTIFLYQSKLNKEFKLFAHWNTIRFSFLRELAVIGIPVGIMQAIEMGAFATSAILVAQFNTTVMLAAHQIMLQYFWVVMMFIMAMSQAIGMRVGHAVGKEHSADRFYTIKIGIIVSLFFAGALVLLFEHYADVLLKMDVDTTLSSNHSLITRCHGLFGIAGILLLIESVRVAGLGCLRGLKDTRYPMFISFCSFWLVGLSSAYVLGHSMGLELIGVWIGLGIGMFFGAVVTLLRVGYLSINKFVAIVDC